MTSLKRPRRSRLKVALSVGASGFLATGLLGLIGAEPTKHRLSAAASPARSISPVAAAPRAAVPDPSLVLLPQPRPERVAAVPVTSEAHGSEPADTATPEGENISPELWRLAGGPPIEIRVGRARILGAEVHLADGLLEATEAGDLLSLPIPELGNLDIEIERIAEPSEGITILQGHLADPEEAWPVSLTRGPGLVLANVSTPTGTWIAEFSGGSGWIAPDDLEDRLVDHSVSDARDPVAEGHAPEPPQR
ncbi:MAG: hypothetical protein ACR2PQ_10730 [Myxococcota bacterium]